MEEILTFDQLPKAVTMLTKEVSELKRLLIEKQKQTTEQPEQLLTIQEAAQFLNLTVPTVYIKVSNPIKQNKSFPFFNQAQTVFNYLRTHVATASMVSEATGIKQKNICRYKRNFEKAGLLWEVRQDNCKITGYKAWYLTTDPAKTSNIKHVQLELTFDGLDLQCRQKAQ